MTSLSDLTQTEDTAKLIEHLSDKPVCNPRNVKWVQPRKQLTNNIRVEKD